MCDWASFHNLHAGLLLCWALCWPWSVDQCEERGAWYLCPTGPCLPPGSWHHDTSWVCVGASIDYLISCASWMQKTDNVPCLPQLRTHLVSVLRGLPGSVTWMGIKCSSWVSISAPSTGRTFLDPMGYPESKSVQISNAMVGRTACFICFYLMILQCVWLFSQCPNPNGVVKFLLQQECTIGMVMYRLGLHHDSWAAWKLASCTTFSVSATLRISEGASKEIHFGPCMMELSCEIEIYINIYIYYNIYIYTILLYPKTS